MVDRPPLPALVDEHRVVAGADPAVAVHREEGRAAHGRVEEGVALAVDERAERAGRAADEHAVARQGAVAAVRRRGEQVVVAVLLDDVGALVAVADRDAGVVGGRGRLGGHAVLREAHLGREDPAVVGAVVQDAVVRDGVAEHVGVEGPQVRALAAVGVQARCDDGLVGPLPRSGGALAHRHTDGAVTATGVGPASGRRRLGHRGEEVVAVGGAGVDDVGRPERRGRVDPGREVAAVEREGVADVGPVHQVGRDHRGDAVEDRVPGLVDVVVVERVGGAVEVPDLLAALGLAVLSLDDGRVGAAVDGAVTRHVGRERVLVGRGDGSGLPLGRQGGGGPGQQEARHRDQEGQQRPPASPDEAGAPGRGLRHDDIRSVGSKALAVLPFSRWWSDGGSGSGPSGRISPRRRP